jgi:magnesium chelatase subunit I
MKATTLGELRSTEWSARAGESVKEEMRENLIRKLQVGENVFPGIVGYDETVVPQIVNAVLSRHNFILLGLRGQAKTRILRQLVGLLHSEVPVMSESEINDDPFFPVSVEGTTVVQEKGDSTPISWLPRDARYIEKLATPDVTVADIVGDIDPIKAARLGIKLGDSRSVHYGLLPRANRSIFAMNELPDLAGKVQVALLNVMQEGDVQIKGYPIRLPLDVMLVFSANPEDYTARGKIITPLKDRVGSEVRTHYPNTIKEGMKITQQEAWLQRGVEVKVPEFIAETIEEVAFQARDDSRVDKHSGVSQRLPISLLENVISNAEQRAYRNGEDGPLARTADLYAALSAITGKLELEYEGELKGGEFVAREIVYRAIGQVFGRWSGDIDTSEVIGYFEEDKSLRVPTTSATDELPNLFAKVPGLVQAAEALSNSTDRNDVAVAAEFVLEGLCARKKVARSQERGYIAIDSDSTEVSSRGRWN